VENISAYAVSKTALIRLTEIAAYEIQSEGVTIFVIHPGNVQTPLTDFLVDSPEASVRAPNMQQFFQDLHATNRLTPIGDSVALVLRLASGQADSLSGCYLSVEDDIPALVQQADAIQHDSRQKLRLQV
jgi:NAD(P)-dependent dehydrogenase (short-subunit alcohol dehydrogenase family)